MDVISSKATSYLVFGYLIDILYVVDIFIEFRTTVFNQMTGKEIWTQKTIALNYLKNGFIFDLLASLNVIP